MNTPLDGYPGNPDRIADKLNALRTFAKRDWLREFIHNLTVDSREELQFCLDESPIKPPKPGTIP